MTVQLDKHSPYTPLIFAVIFRLCVGVSDKFGGNMETHEFITTKTHPKGWVFFIANF